MLSGNSFQLTNAKAPTNVTDAAITTGTATLVCATSSPFTVDSVGVPVQVAGAGPSGGNLYSLITEFTNNTTVTLDGNAGTTVSGATAIINYASRVVTDAAIATTAATTLTSATANSPCLTPGTISLSRVPG